MIVFTFHMNYPIVGFFAIELIIALIYREQVIT